MSKKKQKASILLILLAFLAILVIVYYCLSIIDKGDRDGTPSFIITSEIASEDLSKNIFYQYYAQIPIQDNKFWIQPKVDIDEVEVHYLIDVANGTILGKLSNGSPEAIFPDGKSILVITSDISFIEIIKIPGYFFASQKEKAILKFRQNASIYNFWKVSLNGSKPESIYSLKDSERGGYFPFLSPTREFYAAQFTGQQAVVLELSSGNRIKLAKDVLEFLAWSSRDKFLYRDTNANLCEYQISTKTNKLILKPSELRVKLTEAGMEYSVKFNPIISLWNGTAFNLYLSYNNLTYIHNKAILIDAYDMTFKSIDHNVPQGLANGSLNYNQKLIAFRDWDSTGRWLNQVKLFDIDSGTSKTIDQLSPNSLSVVYPIFHHDRILYIKDNQLWSVNINGTDIKKLYP